MQNGCLHIIDLKRRVDDVETELIRFADTGTLLYSLTTVLPIGPLWIRDRATVACRITSRDVICPESYFGACLAACRTNTISSVSTRERGRSWGAKLTPKMNAACATRARNTDIPSRSLGPKAAGSVRRRYKVRARVAGTSDAVGVVACARHHRRLSRKRRPARRFARRPRRASWRRYRPRK